MAGQSPHDALFKRFLSRPEQARAQLQAVLPAGVCAGVVWEQLRLVPDSFVDEDLRWRHTDLLFTVPVVDGDGEAFIYVLVEHQSSPDPVMPLRMLRYLVRIWDRFLTQSGADRLPPIFPVVLSHGPRWRAPTSLVEMIDADAEVAAAFTESVQFSFLLDDLAASDLGALRQRALSEQALVVLALLQHSPRPRDVAEVLLELHSELTGFDQADLSSVWMYVHVTSDMPPSELYRLAEQLGPAIQEAYMTTAEALRTEGRAEGRTEGRMAGRAEGRAETLLQQIAYKFGPLDPAAQQRVRGASPSELTDWTGRILTATTLGELLGSESR